LEGGNIWLGPHKKSIIQVLDWEQNVKRLLEDVAYQHYNIDEWSLGLKLWSRLCIAEETTLEFDLTIQVYFGFEQSTAIKLQPRSGNGDNYPARALCTLSI
jgi:hypothetical protein